MTTATDLSFDAATTPDAAGRVPVGGAWTGFGGAHGGLLVGAAAKSMRTVVDEDRALRSIHVDLQGAVAPGVLELNPALDRAGRSVTFARVTARQAGRDRFTATGVYGEPGAPRDYAPVDRGARPQVPGPEDCERWHLPGSPALTVIEYRPATPVYPGGGHRVADMHCWMRIIGDDAPVDEARALMHLDAPAPGLYATVDEPFPIPTVEFTAHLLPAVHRTTSPWVLARMQTIVAAEGYAVDDCELWTEDGDLIALGRQLRRAIAL